MTSNTKRTVEDQSEAIDFLLLALILSNSRFQRYYPLTQFLNYQLGLFLDLLNILQRLRDVGWLRNISESESLTIYEITDTGEEELSRINMNSVFQQLQNDVGNPKLLSALQKMLQPTPSPNISPPV
ncbi:hypothetical protein N836_08435 [Leptolyngbya sp. Heron Island J]|uniref:hypothetical protein n=1 Tax=Leptolyngbya sp. Heron Island J TaxID=1385935 RepID=UPI0003B9D7D5|nr:hypothetical protein [Leptolyngbya sp. Heron Island J]ESA36166.1 hypothetical protein N836_08435 [Leptolyngbya sp. Heron Island J]